MKAIQTNHKIYLRSLLV